MLNIVVPIAGKSYFFDNEKDGFPKPFIEICGKTMLEHFIRNYENVKNKRFVFILKEEDVKRYHLDDAINVLTNNQSKIIILKHETQGMVCSVLMAIDEINLNDSLLIVNMDQIFEYDLNEVISKLSLNDAGILSFESVHPRWAYVKFDENNFVLEAFEKKPVSKNAIAGFYYFNKAEFFVKSSFDMIKKDVNYEGKYFIASTLNELILQDKKIINISIDKNRYFTFYSHVKINEYERIKNV
ncbi:glycosyltransferase family 2 protein [Campylobacter jejuni]|uniref:glycosyltransferase family 2 protein n=1 Tax=Campylobacter jejuni TaxID=197 RepID=UPI000875951A|nr:glycosyltransferase family 2 protein [Campylobacter jejuni]AXL34337.1 glycosyl transferase family 2 [Campylobacter jejuni]OEW86837.1 glycosyl transferase family 2 [Campylobacter jejuni]RTH83445.1 glycosyl transferase family 2 [Campylobacter jejuni]